MKCHIRDGVDFYLHIASRLNVSELRLLIVGCYPCLTGVNDVKKRLTKLHELSLLYLLAAGETIAGSKSLYS